MVIFRDGRLDDSDFSEIIEELAEYQIVAEPARPEGASPSEWIVVLEWIRDETEQAFFTALVLALGQRIWRHFKRKGAEPPERVTITNEGQTFSASVSESGGSAGEVRRLILYGSEPFFLRVVTDLESRGIAVYRIPRVPLHLIANEGGTHAFAIIAEPIFDLQTERTLKSVFDTLRDEIGDFRIYDMDGHRDL
jgi:hypothetical protein